MQLYNFIPFYIPKTVAIIGMMGSGKSTIGKRLAKRLSIPFFDSDQEVETASGGYSVTSIYEQWGEAAFKDAENKVIKRLLDTQPVHVLSTGDGAFISPPTRDLLRENAITVWLKANLETLVERVQNRKGRPLLFEGDPTEILSSLIEERYPIYQMADICVESDDETYQDTVDKILVSLKEFVYPGA